MSRGREIMKDVFAGMHSATVVGIAGAAVITGLGLVMFIGKLRRQKN